MAESGNSKSNGQIGDVPEHGATLPADDASDKQAVVAQSATAEVNFALQSARPKSVPLTSLLSRASRSKRLRRLPHKTRQQRQLQRLNRSSQNRSCSGRKPNLIRSNNSSSSPQNRPRKLRSSNNTHSSSRNKRSSQNRHLLLLQLLPLLRQRLPDQVQQRAEKGTKRGRRMDKRRQRKERMLPLPLSPRFPWSICYNGRRS